MTTPREERIQLYKEYKVEHLRKIEAVAKFKVGEKVKWNSSRGKNMLSGIVFEIESVDLDHTHGGFNGVHCGHLETCYAAEHVDYSLVAYTNDGKPIRTRHTEGFIVRAYSKS